MSRKVTDEDVEEMKALREEGLTYKKIAEEFDVSSSTVSRYLKGVEKEPTTDQKSNADLFTSEEGGLVEELAKMAFIEDRGISLLLEATLMKVSEELSGEKIFNIMLESGNHYDKLINGIENLEVEIENFSDKFSDIADLLFDKDNFSNKTERDVLKELVDLENNLIHKYELVLDLLDGYEKDKIIKGREAKLEVGEVKEIIIDIIEDKERHAEIVRKVLFEEQRQQRY